MSLSNIQKQQLTKFLSPQLLVINCNHFLGKILNRNNILVYVNIHLSCVQAVCNMNKVLRSKAESFIAAAQQNDSNPDTLEARKNVFYLDHVCSSTKSFSKRLNFSLNRGTVGESVLQMAQGGIKDGDDEQSDVASFLQKVRRSIYNT